MTFTPEQFNKLATKEEHEELKKDVKEIKDELTAAKDEILTAVDGIAKRFDNFDTELVSNQVAHDRFQVDIDKLKKHIGLKSPAVQVGAIN